MECPLCGHHKPHKHGKTSKGTQRYYCPKCGQTFTETFDTLYYRRQIEPEKMPMVLQAHVEGSSLRGISRTVNLAYNTVISLVRAASQKGQMIHNAHAQNIETLQISSDEFWSFVKKKQKHCQMNELTEGDCWIGMTQASSSGFILATRVGKHTDQFISELINNTEGTTNCKHWHTDDWGGYERVLPPEVKHIIGKDQTQQLERTNGIIRQQIGRWHRRQNKFAKVWVQTEITVRLAIAYFNWIWVHSRKENTAAQRAELAIAPWSWNDLITYPTLY